VKELKTLSRDELGKILEEFKRGIRGILGDKLVEIILFGSCARGDYQLGSDIDVPVIVTERLSEVEEGVISDRATELSLKYDTVISFFEYRYQDYLEDETPFLMNVRKEEIRI